MSARSAVIGGATVGFAFVACGGRSSLDSGQVFGGGAGIAGARAGGGAAGTLGRGGTNARGGSGGSNGMGGGSVGGSDGFGGVGGVSFGGSDGFGGSNGVGGTGFGATAGFGGSFGSAGFGGAAGSGPAACGAFPTPCLSCACKTCSSELFSCLADYSCLSLASCFLSTNCLRFGTCERACAWPLITASVDSIDRAERYVNCALNNGCPCNVGTGGAGGTGGVDGGIDGGIDGSTPVDCENCYRTHCPRFGACVEDQLCSEGIDCASRNCFQSDWEPSCVTGCFNGEPAAGRRMFSALQCATTTCRPWCGTPNGP
jgi:hypothetical protein